MSRKFLLHCVLFFLTLGLFQISYASTILQCRVRGTEEARFINQGYPSSKDIDEIVSIEISSYEKSSKNIATEFIEIKNPLIDLVIRRFPGSSEPPQDFKSLYQSYVDRTNSSNYYINYSEKFPPEGGFNAVFRDKSDVKFELDRRTGELIFSSKKYTKFDTQRTLDTITTINIRGICEKSSNKPKF